jgi:hypothetical protein
MHGPPRAPRDRRYSTLLWRRVREQVRERDNRTCQACGRREPEYGRKTFPVDHKYPGGDFYDPAGLWLLCWSCNTSKAGQDVDRWYGRANLAAPRGGRVPLRPGPLTESPRLMPERSGRPSTADRDYIEWAMALHSVDAEPTDHEHGRWAAAILVGTRRGAFRVCPDSCPSPVRWQA